MFETCRDDDRKWKLLHFVMYISWRRFSESWTLCVCLCKLICVPNYNSHFHRSASRTWRKFHVEKFARMIRQWFRIPTGVGNDHWIGLLRLLLPAEQTPGKSLNLRVSICELMWVPNYNSHFHRYPSKSWRKSRVTDERFVRVILQLFMVQLELGTIIELICLRLLSPQGPASGNSRTLCVCLCETRCPYL